MHMFERENKEPIFVILSKMIALTFNQDEMNEVIGKFFKKIDEEKLESYDTITIEVNQYELCGIYNQYEPKLQTPSLCIMFQHEFDTK